MGSTADTPDAGLREHLTRLHPGIRQERRRTESLATAHAMQHERFPRDQNHAHEPDGTLIPLPC